MAGVVVVGVVVGLRRKGRDAMVCEKGRVLEEWQLYFENVRVLFGDWD